MGRTTKGLIVVVIPRLNLEDRLALLLEAGNVSEARACIRTSQAGANRLSIPQVGTVIALTKCDQKR